MRKRDRKYLAWIHLNPCIVCAKHGLDQTTRTEAHHQYNVGLPGGGGFGKRPDDRRAVPLCRWHASRDSGSSVHSIGRRFWEMHHIDIEAEIRQLNREYDQGYKDNDSGTKPSLPAA